MKVKTILFYLPEGTLNDATEYYIGILEEAFKEKGFKVFYSGDIKEVSKHKYILTIEAKHFLKVKLKKPSAKVINWFQGVVAEEALLTTNSLLRKRVWQFFELFTLCFSNLNFYVSESMRLYFEKKYKVRNQNFFIMPCFNKQQNTELVDERKYKEASFVYAGSMAKWQCVEETICLYSKIEKKIPHSSLTILTKEIEVAQKLIKKYGVKKYNIKYVALDQLDDELRKYKYGFLIRNEHVVNKVATPTKMSSYLALGIIPIYTDTIEDFCEHLSRFQSFIKLNHLETQQWCDQIVDYENKFDDSILSQYQESVNQVFLDYYSRGVYIERLKRLI